MTREAPHVLTEQDCLVASSLDLVPVMLLSLMVTAGKTTEPVPPGVNIMSAFELDPIMLSL